MSNADPIDNATIHLTPNEAIVLFELLYRWCDRATTHTPDRSCFESSAEGAVLHGVLAGLEKQLVASFRSDYDQILRAARSQLEHRWDSPTLNGNESG